VLHVTNDNSSSYEDDRRISDAARRAASMDRFADLLLSVGCVDAAERLSHVAADLREVSA
jgi:hypothetical protein